MTINQDGLVVTTQVLGTLDAEAFVHAIMDTGDLPAMVILCGHGKHAGESIDAVKALCGGRVPDPLTVLGGVSKIYHFLEERGPHAMDLLEDQMRFSIDDHGSKTLFILIHPLCGGARSEVLERMPEAKPLYANQSPNDDPTLFMQQQMVETEIQARHLTSTLGWVRSSFPDLQTEVYRITSGRLDEFVGYRHAVASINQDQVAA